MRLILHAGTHKTGTTSIQKALESNRRWLRTRGFFYPSGLEAFAGNSKPHHEFAHGLTKTDGALYKASCAFVTQARNSMSADEALLLSAEPIYRHIAGTMKWKKCSRVPRYWELRSKYLRVLANALDGFEVEVLLFFRNPNGFAESFAAELMRKKRWKGTPEDFMRDFSPLFDYDRQKALFRRHFSQIKVVDYDDALTRGGSITAFFQAAGLPMPSKWQDLWERPTV